MMIVRKLCCRPASKSRRHADAAVRAPLQEPPAHDARQRRGDRPLSRARHRPARRRLPRGRRRTRRPRAERRGKADGSARARRGVACARGLPPRQPPHADPGRRRMAALARPIMCWRRCSPASASTTSALAAPFEPEPGAYAAGHHEHSGEAKHAGVIHDFAHAIGESAHERAREGRQRAVEPGMALVRLLQLASPALPIGAYSYSQGTGVGRRCGHRARCGDGGDLDRRPARPGRGIRRGGGGVEAAGRDRRARLADVRALEHVVLRFARDVGASRRDRRRWARR